MLIGLGEGSKKGDTGLPNLNFNVWTYYPPSARLWYINIIDFKTALLIMNVLGIVFLTIFVSICLHLILYLGKLPVSFFKQRFSIIRLDPYVR